MEFLKRFWESLSRPFQDPDEDFEEDARWEDEEDLPEAAVLPRQRESLPPPRMTKREAPRAVRTKTPLSILVSTPREFSDVRSAARALQEGKIVVVRLAEADEALSQRITDFLSGAVFLVGGAMQLIGDVLVATPETVRTETDDFQNRMRDFSTPWRLRE